jgi:Tetratricopeptide repeat
VRSPLACEYPCFMEQFNSPSAASSQAPPQTTPVDPLDTGKQAFRRGDYAAAQKFLTAYLQDNPENLDALVLAGDAFYELKQYRSSYSRPYGGRTRTLSSFMRHRVSGRNSTKSVRC